MKVITISLLCTVLSVAAAPAPQGSSEYFCPAGLYSNAQCCFTDVLGVLGLDCSSPSRSGVNVKDFRSICGSVGKDAKCCVLPVAGQNVLCQDAI